MNWLDGYCSVNVEDFVKEFFEVGSSLRSHAAAKVVREDCKEFEDRGHQFSISQIEEIGFELFWERRDELLEVLVSMSNQQGLDFSALLITDIVSNGSLLLMSHEPEFWQEINYPRIDRCLYQLDSVVSRKKQLLPLISQLLENAAVPHE